ncbi:hypothetical protein F511_10795 [Dorcoceras hygrometricum]|uniref:CRM domain-containing protein n=1 Tax=Dorcoceras hygrometricum TaxID=472368 RepID=A0A2Z7CU33_9LAMI|nr:hypothetical protein F511_10795 [Dorcoceras hygrometricum]
MERIVEKLKKFGYRDDVNEKDGNVGRVIEKGSIEDIFYIEEGLMPNTRGGFSKDYPFGDKNLVKRGDGKVRFPWEKDAVDDQKPSLDSRKSRSLAELTLPESELRRLKNLALRIKRKTGGLVIWRSGSSVAVYRGVTYEDPTLKLKKRIFTENEISHKPPSTASDNAGQDSSEFGLSGHTDTPQESIGGDMEDKSPEAPSVAKYEDEVEELLDCLGPRYTDWPGEGPLPIDADLLPGVIPGFQPPFRLLPYGVRSTVGTKEGTALRRLARVLPPHFALGRGRHLQGLAVAMIKLWERSSIAKIALKRGVQLTTSERMAEDLKRLTGGMLLSRNKDFLVFYRGKNFLSPDVADALLEQERLAKTLQDEEEQARSRALSLVSQVLREPNELGTAGTLEETLDANSRWGKRLDDDNKAKVMREAELLRHANLVRKLEKKLDFAERKLTKAERAVYKVEESLNPADSPQDPESLSDEERFMFRKLGLRMKAFLLLGRRGVFGGTVENMHLHWKYRELVKIIVKAQNIEEVKKIALALEAESGGVLVSVDKVSKGYAVIVFRGRDYKRPSLIRPKNLLTKRQALARSIELQRHQALTNHLSALQTRVNQLRNELEHMATVKDKGDEELYDKLDSAYSTENEDSEVEGEDTYLSIYDSENDVLDESDDPNPNAYAETSFPYDHQEDSETEFGEMYRQKSTSNA